MGTHGVKGTSHSLHAGSSQHGASGNGAGSSLNKSLENVIRKAAHKGVEPLRRRYTQNSQTGGSQGSTLGATSHGSTVQRRSHLSSSMIGTGVDKARKQANAIQDSNVPS